MDNGAQIDLFSLLSDFSGQFNLVCINMLKQEAYFDSNTLYDYGTNELDNFREFEISK